MTKKWKTNKRGEEIENIVWRSNIDKTWVSGGRQDRNNMWTGKDWDISPEKNQLSLKKQ